MCCTPVCIWVKLFMDVRVPLWTNPVLVDVCFPIKLTPTLPHTNPAHTVHPNHTPCSLWYPSPHFCPTHNLVRRPPVCPSKPPQTQPHTNPTHNALLGSYLHCIPGLSLGLIYGILQCVSVLLENPPPHVPSPPLFSWETPLNITTAASCFFTLFIVVPQPPFLSDS